MLDLQQYQSIGQALKDALDQFANETCLIEADREREPGRTGAFPGTGGL